MLVKEAARGTAQTLGWRVFPTRDKKPLVNSWPADAAVDVEAFEWDAADGYGIALPPGVVVVDLDTQEGDLTTALSELDRALGIEALDTPRATTRSGGLHLFFSADTEGMRQTKLGSHVDLRVGGKGYVIGAGSPGYEWVAHPKAVPFRPFVALKAAPG